MNTTVAELREKLAAKVAAQSTDMLLASLVPLEAAAWKPDTPEAPENRIVRIAIQREIESRFTPAQDAFYSALVDDWERTIEWTQVEMYTLTLAATN